MKRQRDYKRDHQGVTVSPRLSLFLPRNRIRLIKAEELYTLRAQKSESAQKIAHLDVEVSEQRMAAESAKVCSSRLL